MGISDNYAKNGFAAPGAIVMNNKIHIFYQTYGNGTPANQAILMHSQIKMVPHGYFIRGMVTMVQPGIYQRYKLGGRVKCH